MIPADEMAAILAEANLALDTPIAILRAGAPIDDGSGHKTASYSPLSTTSALFATPSANTVGAIAAQLGVIVLWQVSVPQGTDVKTGDEIQVVSSGETFQVHVARQPQSYSPLLTLLVGELR